MQALRMRNWWTDSFEVLSNFKYCGKCCYEHMGNGVNMQFMYFGQMEYILESILMIQKFWIAHWRMNVICWWINVLLPRKTLQLVFLIMNRRQFWKNRLRKSRTFSRLWTEKCVFTEKSKLDQSPQENNGDEWFIAQLQILWIDDRMQKWRWLSI